MYIPYDMGGLYITNIQVMSQYTGETEIAIHGLTRENKVLQSFMNLMHSPLTALQAIEEEFFCIYCGSVNPLTHRHCSQCGAPRGFLIGK